MRLLFPVGVTYYFGHQPVGLTTVPVLLRYYSGASKWGRKTEDKVTQSCKILEMKEAMTVDEVRKAFVTLAKRFHPDSGSPEADGERFRRIKEAYEFLYSHVKEHPISPSEMEEAVESAESVVEKDFGIKHKPPQFRENLSFEGVGRGTPSKRERDYRMLKANRAADNIHEHRMKKYVGEATGDSLVSKDRKEAKKMRGTGFGFERLVEDLIQESMAKGEFNNLPGSGKPLKSQMKPPNPYVDVVTQKINEVLLDNGFAPEWITLEKDIRCAREALRRKLTAARAKFGPVPLSANEDHNWRRIVESMGEDVRDLNSKVDKYNLVVPIFTKQTVRFNLDKEAAKVLSSGSGVAG